MAVNPWDGWIENFKHESVDENLSTALLGLAQIIYDYYHYDIGLVTDGYNFASIVGRVVAARELFNVPKLEPLIGADGLSDLQLVGLAIEYLNLMLRDDNPLVNYIRINSVEFILEELWNRNAK